MDNTKAVINEGIYSFAQERSSKVSYNKNYSNSHVPSPEIEEIMVRLTPVIPKVMSYTQCVFTYNHTISYCFFFHK